MHRKTKKKRLFRSIFCGSLAGVVAHFVDYPLRYHEYPNVGGSVFRSLAISSAGRSVECGLFLGIYEFLKIENSTSAHSIPTLLTFGLLASGMSGIAANPLYRIYFHSLKETHPIRVYSQRVLIHGTGYLFKGWDLVLTRSITASAYLVVYDKLKEIFFGSNSERI